MDSYLEIAEHVLRAYKRPLSPRAILEEAIKADLLPEHLYGVTQHKTLQARLSEDILNLKEKSRFFRTEPGRFFLAEYLDDQTIPEQYRIPIKARRRSRELHKEPVLCIENSDLTNLENTNWKHSEKPLVESIKCGKLKYFSANSTPKNYSKIWCFSIMTRSDEVLSYRLGRYREHRDLFSAKRTIGFTSLITQSDTNLFNIESIGILESAMNAISIDLDMPISLQGIPENEFEIKSHVLEKDDGDGGALIVVVKASCPNWFEPTVRRLSMNDLQWIPFRAKPNHIEDFDPWSQAIIHDWFSSASEEYDGVTTAD